MIAVIMMNPPLTAGTQTLRALSALEVAQGMPVTTANVLALSTKSFDEISAEAASAEPWLAAQEGLKQAIQAADHLHAAWGLGGLVRDARCHFQRQIAYVVEQAHAAGHTHVWTLLGEPRHPSRWHQFLSDRHGRVQPGPLAERLRQALVRVSLSELS